MQSFLAKSSIMKVARYLNWKFKSSVTFEDVVDIRNGATVQLQTILKADFMRCFDQRKLAGISILDVQLIILKKVKISFIDNLRLSKKQFPLGYFFEHTLYNTSWKWCADIQEKYALNVVNWIKKKIKYTRI